MASSGWSRTSSTRQLPRPIADIEALLNRNRIFLDRTKGIGVISHDDAIAWSLDRPDGPRQRREARPAQG